MKKALIPLCIGLLACACTKDIEYHGEDSGPLLVANSMNRAGQPPYVKLTRSTYFLESRSSSNIIADATVRMDIDGDVRTLDFDGTRYSDVRPLQPGNIVSISADHPLYGHVSATDTVPKPVSFTLDTLFRPFDMSGVEIDTMYYYGIDIGSIDSVCLVDIGLIKEKGQHQYFQLEFEAYATSVYKYEDYIDTVDLPLNYRIPTGTQVATEQLDTAYKFMEYMDLVPVIFCGTQSFTFTDRMLSDTTHLEFEILLEKQDTLFEWVPVSSSPAVRVSVRSMSHAAYTYIKSVSRFRDQLEIMSEPVTMWTNITGGTGILGSYVERRDSVSLTR